MTNLGNEIAFAISQNHGTLLGVDKDIFVDVLPHTPDLAVLVTEYQGSGMAKFTNTSVRSIQIRVRATKNTEARKLIWEIMETFHKEDLFFPIGEKMCLVNIRHTPLRMGVDSKDRSEWVFNMGITYNNNRNI